MASSIQLLRSTTAYERPFPGNLLDGQPAINVNSSEPGLFFKATDGTLVKIGPAAITSDGSPPNTSSAGSSGNTVGELWLDKSLTPAVLKIYDGSQWVEAGSGGGGGGSTQFVRWIYTAVGGETTLSGTSNGVLLEYVSGLEEVFVNGVLQTRGVDYVANNGSAISNLSPLVTGDVVTVTSYIPASTISLPGTASLLRWSITANSGQTVLTGVDNSSQQLVYTAGFEEVFVNGVFLRRGVDYTATNGNSIALTAPLTAADEVTVLAFSTFSISGGLSITNNDVSSTAGIQASKLEFSATTSRSVQQKLEDKISVKDFGATGSGSFDDSASIQAAFDSLISTGGSLYFPAGTYLINSPISVITTKRIVIDGEGAILQAGSNFAFGGLYYDQPMMSIRGDNPVTLSVSALYRNFALLSGGVSATKGSRLHIYDTATTWGGPSKGYVPSVTTFVDYADELNGRINWFPEINLNLTPLNPAIPTELDATNVVMKLYNGDCDIYIGKGVKFVGGVNSLVQDGGGSYQDGLRIRNGRFVIECDFYGLASSIRGDGVELTYSGNILGAYEVAQGNALKIDGPSILRVSDARIMHSRHAIAVGGGTPYEVTAEIVNCEISSSRKSFNETTYPGNQLNALDLHGNSYEIRVSNSLLYGGYQQSSGKLLVENSLIVSQNVNPLLYFVDGTSGPDNGETVLSNCIVRLAPNMKNTNASPPAGSGSADSTFVYSNYSPIIGGSNWKFVAENCTFTVEDKGVWLAGTDLSFENGGGHIFDNVTFRNCRFDYSNCGVRRLRFAPSITGGSIVLEGNEFQGVGVLVGSPLSGAHGADYKLLVMSGNRVFNTSTAASTFSGDAIFINGDTSNLAVSGIIVTGNHIETVGTTSGISMAAAPYLFTEVSSNSIHFVAGSGTLSYAIRTSRNQNAVGASQNFLTKIHGNMIRNIQGSNTITTGIQILGLSPAGSLPVGYYSSFGNTVLSAATPVSTTGSAVATV